ncbi:MAG: SOS response-associated peptidase family protein [Rhodocyclales bacterium]|nr:SOS response-associated peptidase family protein [Rhodocyclales bacterium]
MLNHPANVFCDCQAVTADGRPRKQAWRLHPARDGDIFAMAGLPAAWRSPEGQDIVSACVITTAVNEVMAPIHDHSR